MFVKGMVSGVITVFLINTVLSFALGVPLSGVARCTFLFGILPGGIGGLVGGSLFKKYKWAAYAGGITVALILQRKVESEKHRNLGYRCI